MLCLRIFAFQDVKSVVPYATCVFHSPELCLDLLARWGMSQINLVGAVMCDSVRTLCAEWHLSPPNTATLSKVFLISQEINERKMDFFFFFYLFSQMATPALFWDT